MSHIRIAADPNSSLILLNDIAGKPQAESSPDFHFRGVKGLEDPQQAGTNEDNVVEIR